MINTSSGFQTLLAQSSRHFLARILHDGSALDCDIKNIRICKGACGDDTFTVGSVYSSYAELTINGLSTLLENEDIEIQIGLTVSGSPEYITLGKFTVSKIKSSVYESKITAVGFISSKMAIDLPAVSSQTIPDIISAISTATGLTISLSGLTAAGTITEPLTTMSCRAALELVAFLLGGYATEKADGNIQISKYQIPTNKLAVDGDRMLAFPEFADNAYIMTGVKVIVSEESYDDEGELIPEVSYETQTTVRQIYENKYMTEALFSTFAANVVGYTYMPGIVELSLGDPRLEPWDCLAVTDIGGSTYNVPCLQIVHVFDGGLSTEVVAEGAAESDTDIEGSITKQLGQINSDLIKAQDGAAKASAAASAAQTSADNASAAASAAQTSADNAAEAAEQASEDALQASEDAQIASDSAYLATVSANGALTQLSVVENIVGVLDLLTKNGQYELTVDTEVQEGKWYFVRSGSGTSEDPYTYDAVQIPTGDPNAQGWYELIGINEAIQNYVSSHLVLDNEGLRLQSDVSGTSILLSALRGVVLYGTNGTEIASYGSTAIIGNMLDFHIEIDNQEIGFYQGSNRVAYMNGAELYVENSLSFGNFVFQQRQNGHFTLKLI